MKRFSGPDRSVAGAREFDENTHRRGFHSKFTRMGLSARKLKDEHGVEIKGLGVAKPKYQVNSESGTHLGDIIRSNDGKGNEIYHIAANSDQVARGKETGTNAGAGFRHPDGPFPTRAMAGAAIADLAGRLSEDRSTLKLTGPRSRLRPSLPTPGVHAQRAQEHLEGRSN